MKDARGASRTLMEGEPTFLPQLDHGLADLLYPQFPPSIQPVTPPY